MHTLIEINSTAVGSPVATATVISTDAPVGIPAVGDDVTIPSPFNNPQSGSFQQLTVRNRIFRYTPTEGSQELYVLLVTDSPIV